MHHRLLIPTILRKSRKLKARLLKIFTYPLHITSSIMFSLETIYPDIIPEIDYQNIFRSKQKSNQLSDRDILFYRENTDSRNWYL